MKAEKKNEIKGCLVAILIFCVLLGIGYLNFKIWRAAHPEAKTWTYIFS